MLKFHLQFQFNCNCKPSWSGADCSVASSCPKNCFGNGVCYSSTCYCKSSWGGTDCSIDRSDILCKGKWLNTQCVCQEGQFGDNCAQNCQDCTSDKCDSKCGQQSDPIRIGVMIGLSVGAIIIGIICGLYMCKKQSKSAQAYEIPDSPIQIEQMNNTWQDPGLKYQLALQQADALLKLAKPIVKMNCLLCHREIHIVIDYEKDCDFQQTFHQICITQWLQVNNVSHSENEISIS